MAKKKSAAKKTEAEVVYKSEDTGVDENTGTALATVDSIPVDSDADYEYKDLRRKVMSLREKTDESYWDLAVALEDVYERNCYRAWGFDSWKDYVENEIDIHIRKAQYLVQIQKWFNEMTPAIQNWIRSMGWTKSRMLMHVVTPENAREWRARVDGKTVAEIDRMLKESKAAGEGEGGASPSDGDDEKPKNLNFKLFPGQMDNWKRAAEVAMGPAESDKPGNLLDLICTEYISSNMTIKSVGDLLGKYEKTLGLRLVAYDEAQNAVVYGEELIQELEDADAVEDAEAATAGKEPPKA